MEHTLDYKNTPRYKTYKDRDDERFKSQNLMSEEEFTSLQKTPCHYCDKVGPNGIDRVDNEIGYELRNCVSCCKHCNYVKGNLSQEAFRIWTQRFVTKQTELQGHDE